MRASLASLALLAACSNSPTGPRNPPPTYTVTAQGQTSGCIVDFAMQKSVGSGGASTRLIVALGGTASEDLHPGAAGDYDIERTITIGANVSTSSYTTSVPGSVTFIC